MSERGDDDSSRITYTPYLILLLIVLASATSIDSCRQADRIRDLEWRVDTLEKLRR